MGLTKQLWEETELPRRLTEDKFEADYYYQLNLYYYERNEKSN